MAKRTENEVARAIVDAAFKIHTTLGPGLLESVYATKFPSIRLRRAIVLAHELRKRGLQVERQVPVAVVWEEVRFDEGFRADLLVEDLVIVELKSVETTAAVHKKKLLTYLRLADKRWGC